MWNLRHTNLVRALPSYFLKIFYYFTITITSPSMTRSTKSLSCRFPIKVLFAFPFPSIRTLCPAHIILIIFGEKHKSSSSSLRNFLQLPVTASPFDPNVFPSTLIANTHILYSFLRVKDQVSPTLKQKKIGNIIVIYISIFMF